MAAYQPAQQFTPATEQERVDHATMRIEVRAPPPPPPLPAPRPRPPAPVARSSGGGPSPPPRGAGRPPARGLPPGHGPRPRARRAPPGPPPPGPGGRAPRRAARGRRRGGARPSPPGAEVVREVVGWRGAWTPRRWTTRGPGELVPGAGGGPGGRARAEQGRPPRRRPGPRRRRAPRDLRPLRLPRPPPGAEVVQEVGGWTGAGALDHSLGPGPGIPGSTPGPGPFGPCGRQAPLSPPHEEAGGGRAPPPRRRGPAQHARPAG